MYSVLCFPPRSTKSSPVVPSCRVMCYGTIASLIATALCCQSFPRGGVESRIQGTPHLYHWASGMLVNKTTQGNSPKVQRCWSKGVELCHFLIFCFLSEFCFDILNFTKKHNPLYQTEKRNWVPIVMQKDSSGSTATRQSALEKSSLDHLRSSGETFTVVEKIYSHQYPNLQMTVTHWH